MPIADLIRSRRKALGLSQAALAKLIGVSPGAVGQWEQEDGTLPTVGNVALLRDVLNIEPSAEAAAGAPEGYQLVEDAEKLAWLTLFDLMDSRERLMVARMIRGAAVERGGAGTVHNERETSAGKVKKP